MLVKNAKVQNILIKIGNELIKVIGVMSQKESRLLTGRVKSTTFL